jgi:hypothetical protein
VKLQVFSAAVIVIHAAAVYFPFLDIFWWIR